MSSNILHACRWLMAGFDMMGTGQPSDMPLISGISAETFTYIMLLGRKRMQEEM